MNLHRSHFRVGTPTVQCSQITHYQSNYYTYSQYFDAVMTVDEVEVV